MIVRPRPHPLQLLYIVRGSIIRQIAPKVLFIGVLSLLAVWLTHEQPTAVGTVPFSILAIALSVFLGFRNNACYDRWWEARKHWGDLIVQMRAFARECQAVLSPARQQSLLRRSIGFAHALAGRLRDLDPGLGPWLPSAELATLAGRHNLPDGVLQLISQELGECRRQGEISDIVYQGLQQRLLAMTGIQAACERIRST